MSTLRITGGELRGRRIPIPPRDVRPTSERARQAYFNIVGERIQEARFLDLFAGSGIFSFEAVSRGASAAVAIDKSRQGVATIAELAKTMRLPVDAICADVQPALRRLTGEPFNLVYADPPYAFSEYEDLLEAVTRKVSPGCLIALEHRSGTDVPQAAALEFTRTARYGEVSISFFTVP